MFPATVAGSLPKPGWLAETSKLWPACTLPGPMTIVDTVADAHDGSRAKLAMAFAELLNQEARALQSDRVDVIQFDDPAFNVFMDDVKTRGIDALHRAIEGLSCTTAVHICYGYGIQANIDWKTSLGGEWRQYEAIFPALFACTNCGMAPMRRDVALAKLRALAAGAQLARERAGAAPVHSPR